MAREPIDNPDTTNTDPAYWEQVLRSHGLGMRRAEHGSNTEVVGGSRAFEKIEEKESRKQTGLVEPPGYGPDV